MRTVLAIAVLSLWLVSGPVAMAFDGCAMMGAMCEAPCGMLSYIVVPVVTGLVTVEPVTVLNPRPAVQISTTAISPLEPPPKLALVSA